MVDSGYNDADLTNDGIYVDTNRNGKADRDEWRPGLSTIGDRMLTEEMRVDTGR